MIGSVLLWAVTMIYENRPTVEKDKEDKLERASRLFCFGFTF